MNDYHGTSEEGWRKAGERVMDVVDGGAVHVNIRLQVGTGSFRKKSNERDGKSKTQELSEISQGDRGEQSPLRGWRPALPQRQTWEQGSSRHQAEEERGERVMEFGRHRGTTCRVVSVMNKSCFVWAFVAEGCDTRTSGDPNAFERNRSKTEERRQPCPHCQNQRALKLTLARVE